MGVDIPQGATVDMVMINEDIYIATHFCWGEILMFKNLNPEN